MMLYLQNLRVILGEVRQQLRIFYIKPKRKNHCQVSLRLSQPNNNC